MSTLRRATAVMFAGTALSRGTGLARVSAMAYALGVAGTRLADTFNLANTTPNILYELLLGGVLTGVLLREIVGARMSDTDDVSPIVSTALAGLVIATIAAYVFAPWVVRAYTFRVQDPSVRAAQTALATSLLRWFAPQILAYGIAAIAESLLDARHKFGPSRLAPVLNNLISAAVFITYARVYAVHGLGLPFGARALLGGGTTLAVLAQAIVLLPFLRGEGLRFRPSLRNIAVRRMLRLSVWTVGYVVVNQIGYWVVLVLANRSTGGVTAYQVAFMFFQLPHGLVAVNVISVLRPQLSAAAQRGDDDELRTLLRAGVRTTAFLLAPAAAGYALLAGPVTRLVLAHGVARHSDAALVASTLRAFVAGLVFFSAFQLCVRAFQAIRDTRTPALLNLAAVAVNIALDIVLFARFGVRGLAYGHAISYGFGVLVLGAALSRRLHGLGLRALVAPFARIAAATAAMSVVIAPLMHVWHVGDLGQIAVLPVAGAAIYLGVTRLLGGRGVRLFQDRRGGPLS